VDVDVKNARGHTPLDLATAHEVKELIMKAINTKNCVICKSKFDFKNIRYYCESCQRFLCIQCSKSQWVYETVDSEEKERPVCRCNNCLDKITKSEEDLVNAIKTMDFHTVDRVFSSIISHNIGNLLLLTSRYRCEAEALGGGDAPEVGEGVRHKDIHRVGAPHRGLQDDPEEREDAERQGGECAGSGSGAGPSPHSGTRIS
jgi:FYVE zinc finger